MIKDEELIYRKAILTFSKEVQKVVAMEECGELIQAISKDIRKEEHNVEEEVADLEIMLGQLRIMYNSEKIDRIKEYKLDRLKGKVW